MLRRRLAKVMILALASVWLSASPAQAQFGIVQSGAGPINRSMGGASTAAPLDASGALYWNPASISGLPRSELEIGSELLYPQTKLSSSIGGFTGSDHGDSGIYLIPTIGLVYQPEASCWSYGLGLYAVGGLGANYAASRTNPILFPQPGGLGPVYSNLQVFQLAPTAAYQLTPHLSVGFAPTITMANLSVEPEVLNPPNGAAGFPAATDARTTWGLGFQAGVYYTTDMDWTFGASLKSPQWLQPFTYNTLDQFGTPQIRKLHVDYPLIASLGTSYTGFERWTLAADVRFIDYHNTNGFQTTGFDANGGLTGLGWNSVFALGTGAQYQLTDDLSVRVGYSFNTNPIPNANTGFNVASPVILENLLYLGASYKVTDAFLLSLAYAHAFQNSISGPIESPIFGGAIPGTSVKSTVSADTLIFGATVKF